MDKPSAAELINQFFSLVGKDQIEELAKLAERPVGSIVLTIAESGVVLINCTVEGSTHDAQLMYNLFATTLSRFIKEQMTGKGDDNARPIGSGSLH